MSKLMKTLLVLLAIMLAIVVYMLYIKPVSANFNEFSVTLCHHTPGNNVTLHFNNLQSYLGHLGTPHSGQTFDTNGACPSPTSSPSPSATPSPSPTPTPSPSPSVVPSPTPNPCDEDEEVEKWQEENPCPTPTPEPSEEPSASPSATPEENHSFSEPGPAGPPEVCKGANITAAPTVIAFSRNNPTSVHIMWSPSEEFIHDFIVQYGLGPLPMWNTKIHIESGAKNEMDLNMLPSFLPIWVRVAGTDNCVVGPFGEWIDP